MVETTLITGATSGIGMEFAKVAAREKHNLIIISRSKKKLEDLKIELETKFNIKVHIIIKDLSKINELEKVKENLETNKIEITNLINNAGFGTYGLFKDLDIKKETGMVELNCISLIKLSHMFSDEIIKSKGRILNVASTASFQPIVYATTYAATKAFVLSFSEALNQEMREFGASVTCLCPGPTKTNFGKVSGMDKLGLFNSPGVMSASTVAEVGFKAMIKRKNLVIVGIHNKIGALVTRLLPISTLAKISKLLKKL